MKISKAFHDALWDYSASNVTVVVGQEREREIWMGPREDDYARCEAAFNKMEKLWTFDPNDLEALRTLHRQFLDHYLQGRPEDGQKLLKELDGMIDSLREKWRAS